VFSGSAGVFVKEDVPPGRFQVSCADVSPTVFATLYKSDGDFRVSAIEIVGDTNADIVLREGGIVEGAVLTSSGEPASHVSVVVLPDRSIPGQESFTEEVTRTDQNGRYYAEGLAPGIYRVYAWTGLPRAAYWNQEFMEPYRNSGRQIRVRAGNRTEVNTTLLD
jgi:hypothetical protein